ncbi:hypothetical protein [Candidatus Nitrosotenuis sp. DW1]|uniref:hypothetical protein n=1 Tax=Candidatus Nitrosotenuis sp. DW1 TaxID=2259672 RepID=UPI0015C6BC89|nr:hypothetical protein [Candidatus Nitrosotenuis sp. DW1]QLH08696.1 hypothetical protein DSQ19_03630 [Candidatus Nitrosotenuis sp. DW1]
MHKFALFFMLALTASAVMVLSEHVFAQEMTDDVASEETSDEITTTEEATSEETTDETAGEETDDSSVGMAETTMLETRIDSPLKQMSMGVDIHQIQCSPEYKLVFKASNWNPACVKESSFQTLLAWGWIANHDPSHDELAKMLADHMTKYPPEQDTETEQENEAHMEESMDVEDDASNMNGTDTEQPEPKSHSINLTESMDMGAQ